MGQDLISAAFGSSTAVEANVDTGKYHAELSSLREEVSTLDVEGADYEAGRSVVTSHEFQMQCDALSAAECETAEQELKTSLGLMTNSGDLVLVADKEIQNLPEALQIACDECAFQFSNFESGDDVWSKLENALDPESGRNRLSEESLAIGLFKKSFDSLSQPEKIGLHRLIKALTGSLQGLEKKHSDDWDKKKNKGSWIARGLNWLGEKPANLFGKKPLWTYSGLVSKNENDNSFQKFGKGFLSGFLALESGTESGLSGLLNFCIGVDLSADPRKSIDDNGKEVNDRFKWPSLALQLVTGTIKGLALAPYNFSRLCYDKSYRQEQQQKIKSVSKLINKIKDPDFREYMVKKIKMTQEQKGWTGLMHDTGHLVGEFVSIPAAGVSAVAKGGKFIQHLSHLNKLSKAKSAVASRTVRGLADESADAVGSVMGWGNVRQAVKLTSESENIATLEKIINTKLKKYIEYATPDELRMLVNENQSIQALRKLMRGDIDNAVLDIAFSKSNLAGRAAARSAAKVIKSARRLGGSRLGKNLRIMNDKARSLFDRKRNRHDKSGNRNNNNPNNRHKEDENKKGVVPGVPLGQFESIISAKMRSLSPDQKLAWTAVLTRTAQAPLKIRSQVYELMAKLPNGVNIGRLNDRGFLMRIGTPPKNAHVDLATGRMFAQEVGEVISGSMVNLGFSIKAENLISLQITGSLLRGTWKSSAQGVGECFKRLRGINFEAFARQIYPSTGFNILGGDMVRGWENLQLISNKPIDRFFDDLGLLNRNGTMNVAALDAAAPRIRDMVSSGARVASDYTDLVPASSNIPMAAAA